jgi:hypothetical protein
MPQTIDEIRKRLDRERRVNDRRHGKPDTRIFRRDRRGLERRSVGHVQGDEFMIVDDDILVIESLDLPDDEPGADETRIQLPPSAS